jgi:hypothetical protein
MRKVKAMIKKETKETVDNIINNPTLLGPRNQAI